MALRFPICLPRSGRTGSRFVTSLYLYLLPVSEFAPALFVICIASDVDILSTLRNILPAFFAVLDVATISDRLHPGLALFVFLEPALNLLRRRLHEASDFLN